MSDFTFYWAWQLADLVIKCIQRGKKDWHIFNSILKEFVQNAYKINSYLSINLFFKLINSILNTTSQSNNAQKLHSQVLSDIKLHWAEVQKKQTLWIIQLLDLWLLLPAASVFCGCVGLFYIHTPDTDQTLAAVSRRG